jgi:hypothetical protein
MSVLSKKEQLEMVMTTGKSVAENDQWISSLFAVLREQMRSLGEKNIPETDEGMRVRITIEAMSTDEE